MKLPFLPYLSVPTHRQVEYIAELLALSVQEVRNTTYLPELIRCYDLLHPLPGDLKPSLTFRICPACLCLAEKRFLKRTLALLYVLYCPWHEHLAFDLPMWNAFTSLRSANITLYLSCLWKRLG